MVFLTPDVLASGYLVDFIVFRRLFAMFPIDAHITAERGGICAQGSRAQELFTRTVQSAHWAGVQTLTVMGYNTGAVWWPTLIPPPVRTRR